MVRKNRDNSPDTAHAATWRYVLLGGVLALLTVVAYWPSLSGGFIWDDPDYVVNNQMLRSFRGLVTLWTDPRSLPQWYPMVHTTFWVEYQLFGLTPVVYKITNLFLHITTALLLWRLLLKLKVPGAYMGGLVFALHPVHVESVAWITERKNALSGFFYIAAFLTYLRTWMTATSEQSAEQLEPINANKRYYGIALVLFIAALLSKSVTASFPAAMLVVIWWKRGRVLIKDIKPLVPFFCIGIALGSITAWLERHHVGAVGSEWDYSPTAIGEFASRCLIAGRALWFYAEKLLWPHPVAFMYGRWPIDVSAPDQWIYPIGVVVVILALFGLRKQIGRGPIAAVLLFVGTLFPAIGFFNVYPHRYSFVADHFQHLASIAITSLVCAGFGLMLRKLDRLWVCVVFQSMLAATLGTITFLQGFAYKTEETLWLDTVRKSPDCWVAYTNLGKIAEDAHERDKAVWYHIKALQIAPYVADTWYNMGAVYATQQQWDRARDAFTRAVELTNANTNASMHIDSLIALSRIAAGHENDAVKAELLAKRAIECNLKYPAARLQYARLLMRNNRAGEALEQFADLIELAPADFEVRSDLGELLINLGRFGDAAEHLQIAVRINPMSAPTWTNLGWAEFKLNRTANAAMAFNRALSINPNLEQAKRGLQELSNPPK